MNNNETQVTMKQKVAPKQEHQQSTMKNNEVKHKATTKHDE